VEEERVKGDLFVVPRSSYGESVSADPDILPALPPIGDSRRRNLWAPEAALRCLLRDCRKFVFGMKSS
jgi:hypothetical protein